MLIILSVVAAYCCENINTHRVKKKTENIVFITVTQILTMNTCSDVSFCGEKIKSIKKKKNVPLRNVPV